MYAYAANVLWSKTVLTEKNATPCMCKCMRMKASMIYVARNFRSGEGDIWCAILQVYEIQVSDTALICDFISG